MPSSASQQRRCRSDSGQHGSPLHCAWVSLPPTPCGPRCEESYGESEPASLESGWEAY